MKKFLNVSVCFIISFCSFAQQWEWAKKLTGDKNKLFVDITYSKSTNKLYTTGNFGDTLIFSGDTVINPLSPTPVNFISSAFINSISTQGLVNWTKILYGKNVKAASITFYNNKIYATGNYVDTLFVDNDTLFSPYGSGTAINASIYLICLDTSGNIIFVKDYGYSTKGYYPEALAVSDSGVFISGKFDEIIYFNNDTVSAPSPPSLFFTKTDLNGNRLWTKAGYRYYSSKRYSRFSQILIDRYFNVYLTGHYTGSFIYGSTGISGSNAFILKSDVQGNLLSLSNIYTGDSLEIFDAQIIGDTLFYSGTALSNIIIGNDTINTPLGTRRAFLTQTDTGFNAFKNIIAKEYNTRGSSLTFDKSDNLYWTIQFDTALTILNNSINGYDFINHAIAKITNFNTLRYEHIISGNDYKVSSSATDDIGNFYIAGFYNDIQYYDSSLIITNGINDGFLSKISCKPSPPIIFSNDTTICWNEQKNIWVNSNDYLIPLWQNGSNDTLITINQGGLYSCQLIDENGCASDSSEINILAFPRTQININQLCDSLFVNYPTNGEWWHNGIYLENSNQLTASNNGWYIYQNTDTNNCFIIDSIYLNKQPVYLELHSACDSLVSIGTNTTVVWYQNFNAVDTAYYYIVSESGDYYFTYTDSIGCQWSSDTIPVSVGRFSQIIDVRPNPVKDNLWIDGLYKGNVRIYDITGVLRKEWTFNFDKNKIQRCQSSNQQIPVDISSLPVGVYIIQIETDGLIWTNKIIKQ